MQENPILCQHVISTGPKNSFGDIDRQSALAWFEGSLASPNEDLHPRGTWSWTEEHDRRCADGGRDMAQAAVVSHYDSRRDHSFRCFAKVSVPTSERTCRGNFIAGPPFRRRSAGVPTTTRSSKAAARSVK